MATISGIWKLKEDYYLTYLPEYAPMAFLYQDVKFISGGIACESIHFDDIASYTWITYLPEGSNDGLLPNTDPGSAANVKNEKYYTINFGSDPQTVSDEFLTLMNVVAEEIPSTTISGIWKFRGESYCHSTNFNDFKEPVNFTANGHNFTGIAFYDMASEVQVSYVEADETELQVMWHVGDVYPTAALTEYYTVDFGTVPQTVSDNFMTFMTAIADKQDTELTISGKWEIIYLNNLSSIPNDITQEVNFTSYGSDYTHISISPSGYIDGYKIVNGDYENVSSFVGFEDGIIPTIWVSEIDFGSTPQVVSKEFLTYFEMLAIPAGAAVTISGVWRLQYKMGSAPAPDLTQEVNFIVNGRQGVKLEFHGLIGTTAHYSDGTSSALVNSMTTPVPVDFGEEPQEVSKDFIYWMNHLAEPWAKVSGMWIWNDGMLDCAPYPQLGGNQTENVNFKHDLNSSCTGIRVIVTGMVPTIYYVDATGETLTYHMNGGGWLNEAYKYIQFGDTQYVSPVFKEFLELNAIEAGDYAIEAGEYCFKLNLEREISKLAIGAELYIDIPFKAQVLDGPFSFEMLWTKHTGSITVLSYMVSDYLAEVYSYSTEDPAKFPEFGWKHSMDGSGFQSRIITITEKTQLTYKKYNFLKSSLIPLTSKNYLDIVGTYTMSEDMKKITDLCIKYAKYTNFTPVADVLFKSTNGASSVTGMDFSKYTYISMLARASGTFVKPTYSIFPVQLIKDLGSVKVQIYDPKYYRDYTVTNTSITPISSTSSYVDNNGGNVIYEVIGYRWDAALETIPEEPTPTYSYQYVEGQLMLASPAGKYFNNYYNSDYNTEFRVELNFRIPGEAIPSSGVELASNTANANNNWSLSVNSNGNVVYKQMFDGKTGTGTWTNWTITPGQWYSLSLYSNNVTSTNNAKGQFNLSVLNYSENPVHTGNYVTKSMYYMSQFSTKRPLYIGGDNVNLRNTILVKGSEYESGVTDTQYILNVDIDNATVGSSLSLTSTTAGTFTLEGGEVIGVTE